MRHVDAVRGGSPPAQTQIQNLLVTAPDELRQQINAAGPGAKTRAAACRRLRPDMHKLSQPAHAAKLALRTLACRIGDLDTEVAALDEQLEQLVQRPPRHCPRRSASGPFTPRSS